jgi:hypothetical protein
MAIINSDRLHWSKDTKTLSEELSSLRDLEVEQDLFEDGIRNANIKVKSVRTGKIVTYVFSHRDMDGSGEDCYGYNFVPSSFSKREFPGCANTRLLLIND